MVFPGMGISILVIRRSWDPGAEKIWVNIISSHGIEVIL